MKKPVDLALESPVRRFRTYPTYRNSGADWLPHVPAHWKVRRIALEFRIENGATPTTSEPSLWDGEIPWVTPDDLGSLQSAELYIPQRYITMQGFQSCGGSLVPSGSLVLSTRAPIGHLAIAGVPLCTNQGCRSLVFRNVADHKYFFYQILAARPELESWGQGSTFKELSSTKLRNLALLSPPLAEQEAIVAFLDSETTRVDTLIARKERLIDLLQEKRAALITRFVTKGLDSGVPMKDSDVEWLGQIPAHWSVKRLWHLTPIDRKIMYGIVLPGPNVADGVPIVKGGNVAPGRLRLELLNRTSFDIEASYARSRLRGGDLVFAIRGSIGEVAMVPIDLAGANLTQDAARISYSGETHGRWLQYALRSASISSQLKAGALGATIKGINIRDLKRTLLPIPPKPEQERIAKFLAIEDCRAEELIRSVREAIERLQELRTALISAAVTGKIDVRGEAA
jgi:type I restriction enzyme S subunit